jgi:hypothetical protein
VRRALLITAAAIAGADTFYRTAPALQAGRVPITRAAIRRALGIEATT